MHSTEYVFSFTAASLRLNESVTVARYALEHNISDLKQVKSAGVVFGSLKSNSTERLFLEIRKRLETLTRRQIELLSSGDLITQKQVALLAVCKCYEFISDFVTEVVRDKTLVYDYQLNEADFNSYVSSKQQAHPELELFEVTTFKKAKQVMFLMFEQAGLIDNHKNKRIQPQLLSPSLIQAITDDNRNLLKIFLYSDRDIKALPH